MSVESTALFKHKKKYAVRSIKIRNYTFLSLETHETGTVRKQALMKSIFLVCCVSPSVQSLVVQRWPHSHTVVNLSCVAIPVI